MAQLPQQRGRVLRRRQGHALMRKAPWDQGTEPIAHLKFQKKCEENKENKERSKYQEYIINLSMYYIS